MIGTSACRRRSSIRRYLIRGQLDLRPAFCHHESIDVRLPDLAVNYKLESIRKQGLQHQFQFFGSGRRVRRFRLDVETVGTNPSWPAEYAVLLELIREGN